MDKRLLKHLEEQFGAYFVCSCSAPFEKSRFEIVKEEPSSLVAHYTCARCGREHILFYGLGAAVAAVVQTDMEPHEAKKFLQAASISADDVLAVRDFARKGKGNFHQAFRIAPESDPSDNLFSVPS